ncbi:MAG TPA: hypothetical protein PKK06_08240 [Phycisphaerae bacterium]|nr:hypothetical protein [Phycisphaerae bacterium]HNU43702.1 hypothetical protein [Phycisphaerae bacterium]
MTLRIKGVVRLAQHVRRELAQPITAARREHLRHTVAKALAQVHGILAAHNTTLQAMPAPTRRAYQFLAGLKLDEVVSSPAPATPQPRGDIKLIGLKAFWDRLLDHLAHARTPDEEDALYRSIVATSQSVERHLHVNGLDDAALTASSHMVLGWLAYFRPRENFNAYVAAVARARPILDAALQRHPGYRPPAVVHFRPLPSLYRLRAYRNATRFVLPTPMIALPAEFFAALADAILNGGSRQPVVEALGSDECQVIQAELDVLGGQPEQARGLHHDLVAAFERVNARYFAGALARPRLTWSRTFSGRKFGHYDTVRDSVMISCTLDRPDVPPGVLDFVVYHELLHKQLGVNWSATGRAAAHTPEFCAAERRFDRGAEAHAMLQRLARER